MKKILFASLVSAVALFTGCELTTEDPSCDVKMLGVHTMCVTSTNSTYVHETCQEYNTIVSSGYEDFGCPGGETKACTDYDGDVSYTVYYYTDTQGMSCDELLRKTDDYGFEPDDPNYMKVFKAALSRAKAAK